MFELEIDSTSTAKLKVIGCGGAGGNAVNRMIGAGLRGVEFISANTDVQALNQSLAPVRLQMGAHSTRGLGSGGDPTQGRRAAEEDEQTIADSLADSDMVFITAGMGGGTGTGGAPVIARLAKKTGALTVAVVTKPFAFEGRRRMRQAEEGLSELRAEVDTLIVIPNERLLSVVEQGTTLTDAFGVADEVLLKATRGISDLVTVPGLVNLDFADVKAVMSNRGNALMGTGRASGTGRALEAAQAAVSSPLLEDVSISGAEGVLVNITGGRDLTLHEVNEAASVVVNAAGEEANVIFGAVIDPNMDGEIMITVIATGFGPQAASRPLGSSAETPVDLSAFTDSMRLRPDVAQPPPDGMSALRLSIARRPLLDLPLVAAGGLTAPVAAMPAAPGSEGNPDVDLSSTFDVPAFLRRQEG